MSEILLSIIIPVHNNWHFTKNCLIDLSHLPPNHEVIVIDNGSTDGTDKNIELISKKYFLNKNKPQLVYSRWLENHGFSSACNLGFAKSWGQYVMFLNNDIRVVKDKSTWTQPLLDAAKGKLVGPTAGALDTNFNFVCEASELKKDAHINYISGWNITSDRETWYKLQLPEYIGPFTEEFGTYFEDTDLSVRAKQLGIELKIVPVPVSHFGKATSKKLGTLKLYLPAKEKFIKKWKNKI